MISRTTSIVAFVASSVLGMACAAAVEAPAAPKAKANPAPLQDAVSSYRQYVKEQADFLVGMTKLLATEIKAGNVEAAQSAYAPAHRYLARIEPIVNSLPELRKSMDAHADAFVDREADPAFSGFHRIEYGLFANHSTAGLNDYADRLYWDSRDLRERLKLIEIAPSALAAAASELIKDVAGKRLDGNEEQYSKTDLWDFEANLDGVQEIVALMPRVTSRDAKTADGRMDRFTKIQDLLAKYKDGCGFRSFDELSRDDKMALKAQANALAAELSNLQVTSAID